MHRLKILGLGTLLLATFGLALSGCGANFEPSTPSDFVVFEDEYDTPWYLRFTSGDEYPYRSASADGIVLGIRHFENDPSGTLPYWTEALKRRLEARGHYELVSSEDVKNDEGVPGKRLVFAHRAAAPQAYRITLYLHDDTLFLVEAGGPSAVIEARRAELDQAAALLRLR
jgi:hypothetical protein